MNELSKRLKDNYLEEVREYLDFLASKGFILMVDYGTTNLRVNQYNARKNKFYPRFQMFEFPNFVLQKVPNYFKLDVHNDIVNLARDVLPELSHDELRDYRMYLNSLESGNPIKSKKKNYERVKKVTDEFI